MEKFLVASLINHMIGCMVMCIKKNSAERELCEQSLSELLSRLVVVD